MKPIGILSDNQALKLNGGILFGTSFMSLDYLLYYSWFILGRNSNVEVSIGYVRQVDPICFLCNNHLENLNHLFFECTYTFGVLTKSFGQCHWCRLSSEWNVMLFKVTSYKGVAIKGLILFLLQSIRLGLKGILEFLI